MRVGKKVVRICAKAKTPRQSQGGGGVAPANRAGDGGDVGAERPSANLTSQRLCVLGGSLRGPLVPRFVS